MMEMIRQLPCLLYTSVEYHVLGETYKKVRTFRGYIMKSWRRDGEPYVRVTKNDCLSIAGGRMGKSDAQNMWPLGSRCV